MEQFYLEIRNLHIGAVIASGCLFLLRAFTYNLFDARWPLALPVRIVTWSVDTVLLTAALMLTTVVQQFPFVDNWLTMKLLLLVVYIMFGWWAFRAKHKAARLWSMCAGLLVFGFIITVARAHNPLGILSFI